MVPLFALAGLLWTFVYYYYHVRSSAIIPGCYVIVSIMSLVLYRWHKNFPLFRNIQLLLILLLPSLLHLSLGGFISSSAVILWAALCPLGALAFHNTKAASYWMAIFVITVFAAFLLDNKIFPVENKLPGNIINIFFVLNISMVTFLSFFVLRYFVSQNEMVKKQLKKEQDLLAIEREKSENLLLNILPPSIARRLKDGEKTIANEYNQAAVLFADIVDFTKTSENTSPGKLVENLNKVFTHFDNLVEKFGVEKIKTIGDSYMVVSGLSSGSYDHLEKMADLALAMLAGIDQFSLDGKTSCAIRIGIHAGPVIAGVIGSKKFSYDVWGDTVNTASRMESFGKPGSIQISERFYDHVKNSYECEHRGQIEIKSKGLMNLYFLKGKKPITN